MSLENVAPLSIAIFVAAYSVFYRFYTTGAADSFLLSINLATLAILIALVFNPDHLLAPVVPLVCLAVLVLALLEVGFHVSGLYSQRDRVRELLNERFVEGSFEVKARNDKEDLIEAFVKLAGRALLVDCDPHSRRSPWNAHVAHREAFARALTATRLFGVITPEDLIPKDADQTGRLYRWSVGGSSVVVFGLVAGLSLLRIWP